MFFQPKKKLSSTHKAPYGHVAVDEIISMGANTCTTNQILYFHTRQQHPLKSAVTTPATCHQGTEETETGWAVMRGEILQGVLHPVAGSS